MKKPKHRLRHRFERALFTYDRAAVIQAQMATHLTDLLSQTIAPPQKVLEIGVGTGLFTRKFLEQFSPETFVATDLVRKCKEFLKGLPLYFVVADGEEPSWIKGPFDLIVANATFQWFLDLRKAFEAYHQLLGPKGILAFSTFGPQTMKEVFWALGQENPPFLLGEKQINTLVARLFTPLKQETKLEKLYFIDPLGILRHIRATGALGHLPPRWSLKRLKAWQRRYLALKERSGLPLTYEMIFFVGQKI